MVGWLKNCVCDPFPGTQWMVYLPTFGSFLLVNARKYIECLGFYWFDFCSLWADEIGPAPNNPLYDTQTQITQFTQY